MLAQIEQEKLEEEERLRLEAEEKLRQAEEDEKEAELRRTEDVDDSKMVCTQRVAGLQLEQAIAQLQCADKVDSIQAVILCIALHTSHLFLTHKAIIIITIVTHYCFQVEQIFDFIDEQEKEMGAAPDAFAVSFYH